MPAEEDHGRRPVARDVRAGRIHDVSQVPPRQVLLDELLPELPLHERIRGDDADKARALGRAAGGIDRQVEEPLEERSD